MPKQDFPFLQNSDQEIFSAILSEEKRQQEGLELIPSENYVSRAVREANFSVFTNKYSEGYPKKRYYGGQTYTDVIETLAIERACKLFGCKYANVQPLSGAPANIAVYFGLLEPGDTVIGMDLGHGGHLTHGHPVTHMAKVYNFVRYKMKNIDTGEIDYDELRDLAKKVKPKIILAGFSAYSRELDYEKFAEIAKEVGALTMADMAHIAGLIAGKVAKNPFDYGFDIVTTTTHKTLRGPRGGLILVRDSEEIIKKINKSVFPGFQGGPHMHQVAAKAVCFKEALNPKFQDYAAQVVKNAKAMEGIFHEENIKMIGGGTSNHLLLVDVYSSLGINGHDAQEVLDEVGITLNKNAIPDDPNPPMKPSGIRFGTPAITTRGFGEPECKIVAKCLIKILKNKDNENIKNSVKNEILDLCEKFPILDDFFM